MLAVMILAAGGYGDLVMAKLSPAAAPNALRVCGSVGVGLWMLSTAVLAVGSFSHGLLTSKVWWPVLLVGAFLAIHRLRKPLSGFRLPEKVEGRATVWILAAIVAAMWLAGAMRAPGTLDSFGDAYDVMEYHLQAPREYYLAGHIGPLTHNVYSFYPMLVEMLFLLGMCLRGGAYEGMYFANLLPGVFACLSVAAVVGSLRRDDDARGRIAAALLATLPMLLYLCWLALAETAQVFYIAAALLYLREYQRENSARSALCIGLMLGAACCSKYLAVGLIAGPVLLAMLLFALPRPARLGHFLLAAAATLVLFSPWLVRNTVLTGNPVFPLETNLFGRGYWDEQSQQRWLNGHAPGVHPPVPTPPGYVPPVAGPSRLQLLVDNFLATSLWSPFIMALAGVGVVGSWRLLRKGQPWDAAMAIVLVSQLAVWALMTHEMPSRFIIPAAVPACLLAAQPLARLMRRFDWGLGAAVAVACAVAALNLYNAQSLFRNSLAGREQIPFAVPGRQIADDFARLYKFRPDAPVMLVGEAKAFYFPPGTIYATAFDEHPLAKMAKSGESAAEILRQLRGMGVSCVYVDWAEILRLSLTYGYPAELGLPVLRCRRERTEPRIPVLDSLHLRVAAEFEPFYPAGKAPSVMKELVWPRITVFALPVAAPTTTQAATLPAGGK
jgi:4-amino-4-deoxy-L-arabinose transferase-like glycosyltransferase